MNTHLEKTDLPRGESSVDGASEPPTYQSSSPKKRLGAIFGAVLSVVLLFALFREVDWRGVLGALRQVNLPLLLVVGLVIPVSLWFRAIRWKLLLPESSRYSTRILYDATSVGMLANMLLPLRAGEFVRAWAVSAWQPVSFSSGFASIVTERAFDVLALLVMLFIVLPQIESAPPLVTIGANALGSLAAAIVVFMLLAYFFQERMLSLYRAVANRTVGEGGLRNKLDHTVEEFLLGLQGISSLRELGLVFFWSFAIWLSYAVAYQIGVVAFGESSSLLVGITVNVMIALAVAAPSAPGFLGTFQLGCYGALVTIFQRSPEFALAFAILIHLVQFLGMVGCGFHSLSARGIGFRALMQKR